jgi:inorganic pyrophosphatase
LDCWPWSRTASSGPEPANATIASSERLKYLPKFNALKEVRDVESRVREEVEAFFTAAAAFEGKDLKLLQWAGAAAAYDLVKASIATST